MAKVKDIAGGFFNNGTIYSPNGFTQGKIISNAIINNAASNLHNEVQQGENLGAEARKNKKEDDDDDDKVSIAELTGKTDNKKVVSGSPLPSKKDLIAKVKADKKAFNTSLKDSKNFAYKKADDLKLQADELEQEANNTEDEDEKKDLLKQAKDLRAEAERIRKDADTSYNKTTKKETLVSPDSGTSGPTAEAADTSTPGTKSDPNASYGRKANDKAPTPELPKARLGLLEDKAKAEKTLTEKRNERDEFIESARQDKKTAKRNMREQSIVSDDDFDLEDEFDGTDPVVASFFKKGKINKLLKDQIKEQYPEQIAEIANRIKNDPANKDLSSREVRKLINKEVSAFIEPLWENAGGNEQVVVMQLMGPFITGIKKIVNGENVPESTKRLHTETRDRLRNKQNKSIRDKLYLFTWDMAEKGIDTEKKTTKLKGEVNNARSNLSALNAELREHERAVDRARSDFYKGGRKSKTEYKNGWAITHVSGDGAAAQYASHIEERDGKKMYVTYSVTAGSPDTQRDPVRIAEYQEYNGMRNPNIMDVENFAENNLAQVEGGTKGRQAAIKEAKDSQDFETLDGQNYFKYSNAHKIIAPKILKLIIDRGGKIDRSTGKIYTTSVGDFPEGADELYLDYSTAKKLAGKSDEDVARLTGMSLDEVKARQIAGMIRDYSIGDARVIQDEQGRVIYQLPEENKTSYSGAGGRSFYINWNEPHNRKVVEEYAKMGKTKQDIPIRKLKTVNTSRSSEGNIDWTNTEKTKAAEKTQKAQYTGSYKPSTGVLDALIGFGNKNK